MQTSEPLSSPASESADDALTLAALGVVAFILADLTHEGLGHGLATLAVGGKAVLLTTCYFSSAGHYSRWIPAGGGVANIIVGLLALLLLHITKSKTPHVRYFFLLAIAFDFLFAAGYPAYSGIADFGDWAAVIAGLSPVWLWRLSLIVLSISCYYLSLRLLAVEMRPFCGSSTPAAIGRLRRITLIPFLAALVTAALGVVLNPRGLTMLISAALPAAAAAAGLTQLDHFPEARQPGSTLPASAITQSMPWIVTAALLLVFFVAAVGPGIKFAAIP